MRDTEPSGLDNSGEGLSIEQQKANNDLTRDPFISSEDIGMYEISGHREITPEVVARYASDRERYERQIERDADLISKLKNIRSFSRQVSEDVIGQVLATGDLDLQLMMVRDLYPCYTITPERFEEISVEVIRRAFNDISSIDRYDVGFLISRLGEPSRSELKDRLYLIIKKSFDGESGVSEGAIRAISFLNRNLQRELINQVLGNDSVESQVFAVGSVIKYLPEPERGQCLNYIFQNSSVEVAAVAVSILKNMDEGSFQLSEGLIYLGVRHPSKKVRFEMGDVVYRASTSNLFPELCNEYRRFVRDNFRSGSLEDKLSALQSTRLLPESERSETEEKIEDTLADFFAQGNVDRQVALIRKIGIGRFGSRIHEIAFDNFLPLLTTGSVEQKVRILHACPFMPVYLVSQLVDVALEQGEQEVVLGAYRFIACASYDDRGRLFQKAQQTPFADKLVEPALYGSVEPSESIFDRRKFNKTGSELTLLGGSLGGVVISRKIDADSFTAWQKAFENSDFWGKKGFDYTPIEPIIGFKSAKSCKVDVSCGVLDMSLAKYEMMGGEFKHDLNLSAGKIERALVKMGVSHGHIHSWNFCLRFFRNQDGHVDFSQSPRVYLIDFDQARII